MDAVEAKCKGESVDLTEQTITNIKECLKMVGAATVHDLGMENGAVQSDKRHTHSLSVANSFLNNFK